MCTRTPKFASTGSKKRWMSFLSEIIGMDGLMKGLKKNWDTDIAMKNSGKELFVWKFCM